MNLWTVLRGGHHQQLPGKLVEEQGAMRRQTSAPAVLRGPGRVVPSDPIEGHDCLPRWTNGADRRDFSATPYWGVKKDLRLVSMVKIATAAGFLGAVRTRGI